jgi:enoyl reductase-like protein
VVVLNSLLFCVVLLLAVGAVIAFNVFFIRPFQTHWAINNARKIIDNGRAASEAQFRNVYRLLATARNDLEAAKLWKRLDELKDLMGVPVEK